MTTTEQATKETVRRFFTAYADGDAAAMRELADPGFVAHSLPPDLPPDIDGLTRQAAAVHAELDDCRVEIHDLVAEGDRVAARFTVRAHRAGEPVAMTGMELYRLAGARVAELWGEYDTSGMAGG
jgi:ketosteroid isomerase-like protein